jgi:hypothetical protein
MQELSFDELAGITGGYSQSPDSMGGCGPGDYFRWMGNIRTPECMAHDQAVQQNRDQGMGEIEAQARALPKFPAAVQSYVQALKDGKGTFPFGIHL